MRAAAWNGGEHIAGRRGAYARRAKRRYKQYRKPSARPSPHPQPPDLQTMTIEERIRGESKTVEFKENQPQNVNVRVIPRFDKTLLVMDNCRGWPPYFEGTRRRINGFPTPFQKRFSYAP